MAQVILPKGKTRSSQNASQTQNFPLHNSNFSAALDNVNTQRTAGVYSRLYLRVVTNDRQASTCYFRINGANGSSNLSITGSTTGEFEDNTNTDTIVAGDEVNLQLITGATGTTFIAPVANILFSATTNTVAIFGNTDNDIITAASTQVFLSIGGRMSVGSATAPDQQAEVSTAGVLKNMGVRVNVNTRTTNTTVGLYVNSGNGACLVTCTASTTGTFEDTSNTDTVAVGDDICFYSLTGTGTGNFRMNPGVWIEMETTNNKWQVFAGQSGANVEATYAAGITYWTPWGGQLTNDFTATESETSVETQLVTTTSKMQVRVSANTAVGDTIVTLRKNQAAGSQTVTCTGLTTGLFQDTTNSDSLTATDEVNYQIVAGASGTSIILSCISMLCDTVATTRSHNNLLLMGVS